MLMSPVRLNLGSRVLPEMQEQATGALEDILTRRRSERTCG